MKSTGNIASKIHVSPKLDPNYKCCLRFRLSLNHKYVLFSESLHDVTLYDSP